MCQQPLGSEDLLTDLMYLRKGEGMTPHRLSHAGLVDQVLRSSAEDSYELKKQRLVSAIQSLHEPDADILMAAFGLDISTAGLSSLKQRRVVYGQHIGRGIDTVAAREAKALEQLRFQLLTGWYPASPPGKQLPELHNGAIHESASLTTVFSDGCWQQTRHHYRLLALFDEVDYYAITSLFPAPPMPHGNWRTTTQPIEGGYEHRFFLPDPLRRGQSYDLAFTLTPNTPEVADYAQPHCIWEESLAFHERTLQARFEAIFVGEKPQQIWQFSGLTHLQRPGQPTNQNQLDLTTSSAVQAHFTDLYGGLFAGLAWEW